MKKLLKILIIIAALLTAVILTACKQFLDDPEEFSSNIGRRKLSLRIQP